MRLGERELVLTGVLGKDHGPCCLVKTLPLGEGGGCRLLQVPGRVLALWHGSQRGRAEWLENASRPSQWPWRLQS
jgi:hypothetical protein